MKAMQQRAPGVVAAGTEKRRPSTVEIERSLDQLSRYMDGLFRIPGTGWRFGLDALAGLIPGFGDTAASLVSFYVLAAGVRYRVPKVTLLRMAANIGIDYAVGAIPLVGDAFDFFWKSNQMNIELLRQRATVSAAEARHGRTSDWLFFGVLVAILVGILLASVTVTVLSLRYVAGQMF